MPGSPLTRLRSRVTILIFLILVPTTIVMLLNFQTQWALLNSEAQEEMQRLAQLVATRQIQLTESAEQLLRTLVEVPEVQSGNCNELFMNLIDQFRNYTNLYLVDADGFTVCSGLPVDPTASFKEQNWFKATMAERGFTTGDYAMGVVSQRPVVSYGYPVFDEQGEIPYILGVSLDLQWIEGLVDADLLPAYTTITALDRNGTVLYSYPAGTETIGAQYHPEIYALLEDQTLGTLEATLEGGVPRIYGVIRLTGGDTVLVGRDQHDVYADSNNLLVRNLLGLALVALVAVPLIRLRAYHAFVRPVEDLVDKLKRLAAGDTSTRIDLATVRVVYEMHELGSVINQMAESMENRQQSLERDRDRSEVRVKLRAKEMEFLVDTSRVLSSSLDYEATLKSVAHLTIPELGDWCAINVMEDNRPRWVALAHLNPRIQAEGERYLHQYELVHDNLPNAVLQGTPKIYNDNLEEFVAELTPDPAIARMLYEQMLVGGIKSVLLVPLVLRGKVSGLIALVFAESGNRHDLSHLLLGKELGRRAAVAVENSQLYRELQRWSQNLEQRVEERTRQLTDVNHELETFSYSVSHDLRAPLRAIDGFSQALIEDYADQLDEDGQNYLRRVRAATQRMGALIDDLLELSRVTRREMATVPIDLSLIAHEVIEELQTAEPDRKVEVIIQPGLKADGDTNLVFIVLQNLLGNAWKFSSRQEVAKIEFGTTRYEGEEVFFVRDNGAGFDMQYGNKLFGAFQRLHHNNEFEGTGIGLATVQRIVHRHGGWVKATAVIGQGATFYFTLGSENRHEEHGKEAYFTGG